MGKSTTSTKAAKGTPKKSLPELKPIAKKLLVAISEGKTASADLFGIAGTTSAYETAMAQLKRRHLAEFKGARRGGAWACTGLGAAQAKEFKAAAV